METSSITIHQFPPFLQMQASPFGLKLETWLRMKKIPYETEVSFTKMGPKNKVPFATINNEVIGDSELIIDRIEKETGTAGSVAPAQVTNSNDILIRRMVEEHMYFVLMHSRWIDDDGWAVFQPLVFGHIPSIFRSIISRKIRKIVKRNLMAQGISRHSNTEIYAKGAADIAALSGALGNKQYFMGKEPGLVDASAYGFLANLLYAPLRSPLLTAVKKYPNLVAYGDRMRREIWPNSPRGGGELIA
ncbi:MAG: glutathione S-transferase family protein [Sneathiella sp.]